MRARIFQNATSCSSERIKKARIMRLSGSGRLR
jgi:hypothetical protein